jgi:hypothetical protein
MYTSLADLCPHCRARLSPWFVRSKLMLCPHCREPIALAWGAVVRSWQRPSFLFGWAFFFLAMLAWMLPTYVDSADDVLRPVLLSVLAAGLSSVFLGGTLGVVAGTIVGDQMARKMGAAKAQGDEY